jgi:hypothetical protein
LEYYYIVNEFFNIDRVDWDSIEFELSDPVVPLFIFLVLICKILLICGIDFTEIIIYNDKKVITVQLYWTIKVQISKWGIVILKVNFRPKVLRASLVSIITKAMGFEPITTIK